MYLAKVSTLLFALVFSTLSFGQAALNEKYVLYEDAGGLKHNSCSNSLAYIYGMYAVGEAPQNAHIRNEINRLFPKSNIESVIIPGYLRNQVVTQAQVETAKNLGKFEILPDVQKNKGDLNPIVKKIEELMQTCLAGIKRIPTK